MDKKELYHEFISALEPIYGPFNKKRKSFQKASNSKIARELCYSDSQFSRLINNSATEGEYERAVKNAQRSLKEIELKKELKEQTGTKKSIQYFDIPIKTFVVFLTVLAAILVSVYSFGYWNSTPITEKAEIERDSMLKWIFENSSVSPYTGLADLPSNCSYPCYKYQGQWSLKNMYKIPVFREKNGFHYLAKDVNLYTRCITKDESNGKLLEGYEYQYHEIWYDKRELQITSFLIDNDRTKITNQYKNLNFEQDRNFVKIAFVHTFFRNEFIIDSTSIKRSGAVIGRDVEFVSDPQLLEKLESPAKVEDIKDEINSIIRNRLQDFSRPVSCSDSPLPDKNFHTIAELDTMSFNCQLTTANAPIQYTKTYVLNDQYIETSCRPQQ